MISVPLGAEQKISWITRVLDNILMGYADLMEVNDSERTAKNVTRISSAARQREINNFKIQEVARKK